MKKKKKFQIIIGKISLSNYTTRPIYAERLQNAVFHVLNKEKIETEDIAFSESEMELRKISSFYFRKKGKIFQCLLDVVFTRQSKTRGYFEDVSDWIVREWDNESGLVFNICQAIEFSSHPNQFNQVILTHI